MAYLKPPWFTVKVFNKVAMATGVSGTEPLTLTARASGQPQKIPVISVDVDGTRYLVSTRGESQWVKNLRANTAVSITTKAGTSDLNDMPSLTLKPATASTVTSTIPATLSRGTSAWFTWALMIIALRSAMVSTSVPLLKPPDPDTA